MRVPDERFIGGISCFRVLDRLSDYLDDLLEKDEVAQINEHVVACDECRRFGVAFQEVIARLRADLRAAEPLDPQIRQRLFARLQTVLGS
jgi:anti-sigma factor RsiW